jgi:hypothetical protein
MAGWSTVTIKLVPGIGADTALRVLRQVQSEASALGTGSTGEVYRDYMRWVGSAVKLLRPVVHPRTLEDLVLTRRHWALCGMGALDYPVPAVINSEIDDRQQAVQGEITELEARIRRWVNVHHFVVADTCLYLEHQDGFESVDWAGLVDARPDQSVCLIVPMAVIDELDAAKRANEGWKRGRAGGAGPFVLKDVRCVLFDLVSVIAATPVCPTVNDLVPRRRGTAGVART